MLFIHQLLSTFLLPQHNPIVKQTNPNLFETIMVMTRSDTFLFPYILLMCADIYPATSVSMVGVQYFIIIVVTGIILVGQVRRVWRYQRGNQNLYIEEWPKEKVQKDKLSKRSSNTNPTENRVLTQVLWKGKQFLLH